MKRLLTRIAFGLGLAAVWMIWLSAARANATPMKPDITQMIRLAEQPQRQFALARAGWNGPEAPQRDAARARMKINPALALYGSLNDAPLNDPRTTRATLAAVAFPDPRALLAVAGCILLLRKARHKQAELLTPDPESPVENQPPIRKAA